MFRLFRSSVFRSGTTKYPTRVDLIRGLLSKLRQRHETDWVHFESTPTHWVEVAREGDCFQLNFSFPFNAELIEILGPAGILLPTNWSIEEFAPKGWLRAGSALLNARTNNLDEIADFCDAIYSRVYGEPNGRIKAWFDG